MRIRRLAAIWTAKLISTACKLSGRQGVTLAGKVAMKIDPNILRDLASQVRGKIFVVCGTNGKTTTNNLLCSAIESEGKKLVCNRTGSNMLQGIVAAFVLAAKNNGKLDADYACLEVDEASTLRVFPHVKPDYMVLTNLFRDQLDRYGEIDATMGMLERAMKMAPDMTVIVNGDEALTAYLAMNSGNAYKTYGISERVLETNNDKDVKDGMFCKKCGAKLAYEFYHYSQIGSYHCPQCDFKRPEIDYDARNIKLDGKISFDVENSHISVNYRGFYNVYNVLAVYAALKNAGLQAEKLGDVLKKFNPQNGRMEQFDINGTHILLNLAKNPAGFNQNVMAVMDDKKDKDIIIVINDNAGDGIDVSWLWDVDFDQFADERVKSITVCGLRALDMQLRMKYVDIEAKAVSSVKEALEDRIANGTKNLYVLVNYTALFSTRHVLVDMRK